MDVLVGWVDFYVQITLYLKVGKSHYPSQAMHGYWRHCLSGQQHLKGNQSWTLQRSPSSGGTHPSQHLNQPPAVNKYFRQHLLVWMQRKLWQFKLNCPHMDWNKHPLTSAGLYPHVGQVLYLDGYFSLVTKYLECSKCKRNVISWSQAILDQMDVGHRRQFPIIITYNYACDMKVVRFLRQRNSANTLTQFTHNWMSNIMRSGSSALPTIWQIVSLLWRQVNNDLFSPQSLMIHSPAILFPNKNGGSRQEKNTWCSSDYDVNLKPPGSIL